MNIRQIIPSVALMGAVTLSLSANYRALGQSAATDPVGFTTSSLLANSDTRVAIPLTRPAEFTGTISSISGNTITVAATSPFTSNQFQYVQNSQSKTYYAIIGPNYATVTGTLAVTGGSATVTGTGTAFTTQIVAGDQILVNGTVATVLAVNSATSLTLASPFIGTTATGASGTYDHSPKEGSYYTVTSNGTNTLTVNLNGDSLSSIASSIGNTSVTLIPYWTLGTAFPASDAGSSYIVSTGIAPRSYQTQVLFPDLTSPGINLATGASYFNYNGAWRLQGSDGADSYDDTIIPPTIHVLIRNGATATTFTPAGSVYMNRVTAPLDTQASSAQDNTLALLRPTAVTLNDTGLISSGAFKASTGISPRSITDELLVYDNTATGVNKATSASYVYFNNGWRLEGSDGTVDYGSTVTISYGTGFTIRKAPATNGATSFWQNSRNY